MKEVKIDISPSDSHRSTVVHPRTSTEPSRDREPTLADEYSTLASGVGLIDRSFLTKLRLVGADSLDFLQRISTNDISCLHLGSVLQTVLTTEKGRVIDLANVYRLRDSSIMVICHAPRDRILRWMQKFIIMEDVTLTDETSAYSLYSFFGPLIERVLAVIGGKTLQPHNIGKVTEIKTEGIELIIGAVEPVCTIGVNALVRACDAKGLWKLIFEPGTEIDLKVCSLDSLDIHRVERGFPAYGKELTEEVNPLEAGLERFVSFTKGCYIGQEVIARLDTYDKLKRKLMGLVLTEKASVMPGASVTSNGETIGRITSVVDSVLVGGKIALAFIRSAWATHDATVEVGSESGPVTAHLIHLPFEARSYEPEL